MNSKKNHRLLVKLFSAIVFLSGILVLFGWHYDISLLKSVMPDWVAMKTTTAISFLLSGIILYFMVEKIRNKRELELLIPFLSVILIFLMGTTLISYLSGTQSGVEFIFVKEQELTKTLVRPGMPSFFTMINFLLIALAGFTLSFNREKVGKKTLYWIGAVLSISGVIAFLGYIFDVQLMYYRLDGLNSAMAFHTAILFVLIGIGFMILGERK